MKHSLPLGYSQAARSPQLCPSTTMQMKMGREGRNALRPEPRSICCEVNAGQHQVLSLGAPCNQNMEELLTRNRAGICLLLTGGQPQAVSLTDKLAENQGHDPLILHSKLTETALPFNQQCFPNTVRGRTGNGLFQKITFLLNPPVTTSEQGMLLWGLSEPCPPLPPSKTVKVMNCCF